MYRVGTRYYTEDGHEMTLDELMDEAGLTPEERAEVTGYRGKRHMVEGRPT